MNDIDLVIEKIAADLEEPNFLDVRGIAAKRKRDREDADLRMQTRQEQRRELAGWVRSFKTEGGNRFMRFLEEVEEGGNHHFAWGPEVATALACCFVTMTVEFDLSTHLANCTPRFRFALTDEGRARLHSQKLAA